MTRKQSWDGVYLGLTVQAVAHLSIYEVDRVACDFCHGRGELPLEVESAILRRLQVAAGISENTSL